MKKYNNYKDSGIEWIGDIPVHWNVKKLKFISKICNGQDQKAVLDNNGIYPIYGSGGIFGKANSFLFDQPSVLLGRKGTIDKPQYVEEPFWTVDTSYYTKIKDGFSTRLFYYLCTTINFELYKYGSAIPSMTQGHLNEIKFSIPNTFHEQTQIANYLDHKTTQIDTLIAKKEQFISLLHEERTAVINQAVTKGLDPKVQMKESGIEWLGEIPEHWEVKKLKYIKSNIKNAFVDGPFGSNLKTEHFVENGDVYVIDSGLITSGVFHKKREMKTITNDHFETVLRSECKQNDIIIAKIGANFGMSGILPKLDKPSLVSGNTLKLTVNEQIYDLKLIHLQLLNLKTSGEIDLLVKGSAQPALSMGVMSDLPFAIPSTLGEQVEIRNYILNQHKRIDELIFKSKQEIELLKEYKTALISEVVTGKVDVREEVLN